jgi:hypothetical protein
MKTFFATLQVAHVGILPGRIGAIFALLME